jgi:hypothetical protein
MPSGQWGGGNWGDAPWGGEQETNSVVALAGVAQVTVTANGATAGTTVTAGLATVTVAAQQPTAALTAPAGLAAVTVAALNAEGVANAAPAGTAQVSGTAYNPTVTVTATAGVAAVLVAANGPTPTATAVPSVAPVTVTAEAPTVSVQAVAGLAGVTAVAYGPTPSGTAVAGVANVSATAEDPTSSLTVPAGLAPVTVEAYDATGIISTTVIAYPGVAQVSVAAYGALPAVSALPSTAQTVVEAFTAACGVVAVPQTAQVFVTAFDIAVGDQQGLAIGYLYASLASSSLAAAHASGALGLGTPDVYDSQMLGLGPVGWWKLADAVGSATAVDSSGNGATGNVAGGVTFGQLGPISGNTAALFDGSTGYIALELVFPGVGNAALGTTVIAWYNMPADNAQGAFITIGNDSAGYSLGVGGGGTWDTVGNELLGVYQNVRWVPSGVFMTPGWHMTALAVDGDGYPHIYLDGQPVYTDTFAGPDAPDAAYIGADSPTTHFVSGDLAEVGFFDNVLTGAQIAGLYAAAGLMPGGVTASLQASLAQGSLLPSLAVASLT